MGYRYRLQWNRVPGRPDVAFPGRRKAILVHGCFWHRHEGCPRATTPKTRADFWEAKFQANIARDTRDDAALKDIGWTTLVIWECELSDIVSVRHSLLEFLGPARRPA